jgi:hypothetical protein
MRRDGTSVTEPQPARGYSRAPFTAGNRAAVKHGAFSPSVIDERAVEISELLLRGYPYLAEDVFSEALHRYVRAEARAVLLNEYVMSKALTHGVESVPAYLWSECRGADLLAQKCGSDCGLDAAGHSKIARDLGIAQNVRGELARRNIGNLQAEGRRLAVLRQGD